MLNVIFWTFLFTLATVFSVVLIGARDLIGGDIGPRRMLEIIFDWRFILGAVLAFAARIFFVMINNSIYKIPHFANSSTTVTFLVTIVSLFFIVIANYYFLDERLNFNQIVGGAIIFLGVFFLFRGA